MIFDNVVEPEVAGEVKIGAEINETYVGMDIQSRATYHLLGFVDENLGSYPAWWAATVATFCPSRLGELPRFLSSKPSDRPPRSVEVCPDT